MEINKSKNCLAIIDFKEHYLESNQDYRETKARLKEIAGDSRSYDYVMIVRFYTGITESSLIGYVSVKKYSKKFGCLKTLFIQKLTGKTPNPKYTMFTKKVTEFLKDNNVTRITFADAGADFKCIPSANDCMSRGIDFEILFSEREMRDYWYVSDVMDFLKTLGIRATVMEVKKKNKIKVFKTSLGKMTGLIA